MLAYHTRHNEEVVGAVIEVLRMSLFLSWLILNRSVSEAAYL